MVRIARAVDSMQSGRIRATRKVGWDEKKQAGLGE